MAIEQKELQLQPKLGGKVLEIHATGKLTKDDYERFGPHANQLIQQHGKIRVLLYLHDFEGWTASALWEDVKFDWKHFKNIERLAIVGESKWQQGMAAFCKPFTTAEVKYFDHGELSDARQWIEDLGECNSPQSEC